jgi:hypothetical protein
MYYSGGKIEEIIDLHGLRAEAAEQGGSGATVVEFQ